MGFQNEAYRNNIVDGRLDSTSRRQLKQDLIRGIGDPFDGSPEHFWAWQQQMSNKLMEAECSALDSTYILKANSVGRPKKLVTDYLAAGSASPTQTLADMWSALKNTLRCKYFSVLSPFTEAERLSEDKICNPGNTDGRLVELVSNNT